MTPVEFYTTVLIPALNKTAKFAPKMPDSPSLRVLMMAISGQEANWDERVQIGSGEARGLFQMELTDISDIMENSATKAFLETGLDAFGIKTKTAEHLFEIITAPEGDTLAAFLARLNLWADPWPIPPYDDQDAQYEAYLRCWKPGTPRPNRWPGIYGQALATVMA